MNENNFNSLYQMDQANLEKLKQLLKKSHNKQRMWTVVLTIILTIAFALAFKSQYGSIPYGIIIMGFCFALPVGLILGAALSTSVFKTDLRLYRDYEEAVILGALKQIFEDVVLNRKTGLPEEIIANTHMIQMNEHYSSNDLIIGKYKGIIFEQSDVEVYEIINVDGDTSHHTLFLGRWMIFDFNKSFKKNIHVIERGFENATTDSWYNKEGYKSIQLEDMLFVKNFKVYSQDEIEAFYVLTPPIMEAIKRLKENINGSILLGFVDNHLHVAVQNGEDALKNDTLSSMLDQNYPSIVRERVIKEMNVIAQFIDELNLNKDIFIKED